MPRPSECPDVFTLDRLVPSSEHAEHATRAADLASSPMAFGSCPVSTRPCRRRQAQATKPSARPRPSSQTCSGSRSRWST